MINFGGYMKYIKLGLLFIATTGNINAMKSIWYHNKNISIDTLKKSFLDGDEKKALQLIKWNVPLDETRNGRTLLETLFRSTINPTSKLMLAKLMLKRKQNPALIDENTFLCGLKLFGSTNLVVGKIVKRQPITKKILSHLYRKNDPRFQEFTQLAAGNQRLTWIDKAKLKLKIV